MIVQVLARWSTKLKLEQNLLNVNELIWVIFLGIKFISKYILLQFIYDT
jgi:hypothetical protein